LFHSEAAILSWDPFGVKLFVRIGCEFASISGDARGSFTIRGTVHKLKQPGEDVTRLFLYREIRFTGGARGT
jgi:hypothetical protein